MSPTFRSLRVRNYRRYATGQLLANTGVWMQRVAQDWLVLDLTNGSPMALGLTVGLQFLPMLLFGLWGGGLADRFRRRQMLLVTSTALGALALLLGTIAISGLVTVPLVMFFAFAVGAVAAIDAPTRQAFVSEMVEREDLPNAVALSTASFNLGRVFGPAVAGLLIAAVGSGWVFIINALGYVAVIIALRGINIADLKMPELPSADRGNLREGLRYVKARPELVMVLAIAFFVGTFGLNFQLTIASMTTVEFGLGPAQFGLASTVLALGSLAGSLAAARRGPPRLRLIVLAAVAFGAAAVTVSLMPTYVAFLVALPLVGMGALTLINATQSYLQLGVEPHVRGRVMGIYTLLFLGGTPLGSPLVGWVAENVGPRWSIALGGIVSAFAALVVAALRMRSQGLAVQAHIVPKPHLHIGSPQALAEVRKGRRLALGTHVTVLLLAAVLATSILAFGPLARPARADDQLPAREYLQLQDERIDEASGMATSLVHDDLTWIVNDSKGGAYVYGVDETGATVSRLTLANIANRDWEAMANGVDDSGDPALWIGDIGDNDSRWDTVKLYRISEPEQLGDQSVPWRRYELQYPDGAHNAEALMVDPDTGSVYVATKEALGAGIYATDGVPQAGEVTALRRVASAPMFVTDGAISFDGSSVALRSYTNLYLLPASVLSGDDVDGAHYNLPRQPQGETLAFMPADRELLIGSEGIGTPIYALTLPKDGTSLSDGDGSPGSASTTGDDDVGLSAGGWLAGGLAGVVIVCFATAAGIAYANRRRG